MKISQARIFLFLALFALTFLSVAQDDTTATVVGSRIVTDVLGELPAAEGVTFNPTGTTGGFAAFCAGEAAATGATRPMTVEEEAACEANGVEFREYLIGYDAIALVGHADVSSEVCLTPTDLNALLAPSAEGVVTDWTGVGEGGLTAALSVFLLPDNTSGYALLDALVEGLRLRADVTTQEDSSTILEAVTTTSGAVGLVKFSAVGMESGMHLFELENTDLGQCVAPTLENIETRRYPAADRVLLYVNEASTDALNALVSEATGTDAVDVLVEAGITAPSEAVSARNTAVLEGNETADRPFSADVTEFQIPPSVIGTVEVAGSANLNAFMTLAVNSFTSQYPAVTVNSSFLGEANAFRRLCNGEVGLIASSRDLPEAEVQNCAANNIETITLELGQQAVVLVANAGDSYLQCLTTQQVFSVWGATSATPITNWSDVDASFPATPVIWVSPAEGEGFVDLLLTPEEGAVVPLRTEVAETNRDPLYRAAAIANAPGAITFMPWAQYQQVAANEQANIQLVAVDGGNGCIAPSEASITDGSYPYTLANKLIVSQSALADPALQSLLWYLFSDEAYTLIESSGLIGVSFGDLPQVRIDLQTQFNAAVAAAAAPPEVTAEPGEVTPEANAEATEEPADAEATAESGS
ncbi:MAG: hypothetical protein OHK0046_07290 [Anaerolineae bacterium]